MKKIFALILAFVMILCLCSCEETAVSGSKADAAATVEVGNKLSSNQPTPTDIKYSLERYNLIKRAYWVNGNEEKARSLPCPVTKPLGYVTEYVEGVGAVAQYAVDGKVSSLNSFLSPDSEYYEISSEYTRYNDWLPDVDGSYGENDSGIFFFTPAGVYEEWTGIYSYSSQLIEIDGIEVIE